VDFLTSDIEAEEATTGIHDMSDPDYSLLARSLRARRGNLRVTIGALEALVQRALTRLSRHPAMLLYNHAC
jgi:hypothetical protein